MGEELFQLAHPTDIPTRAGINSALKVYQVPLDKFLCNNLI